LKKLWRLFILVALSLVILLGVFYARFILDQILTPIALAVWLFLRLSILPIDQKYYWFFLIFVVAMLAIYQLSQILLTARAEEPAELAESNAMLNEINNWNFGIQNFDSPAMDRRTIQQELASLLVLLHASRKSGTTRYETLMALKQRQIPLPEHVYRFVFTNLEDEAERPPVQRFLRAIQNAPRKWVRRWTGREKAQTYQSIENILSYIERSLETTNGDEYDHTSDH
jgi:hypothetical protein